MERESNAMPPQCRAGCGFYGNPTQDGFCSVCYKDLLRKKQQPPVSSTPSSNNGPQPPASGQSVTASAVNLRSVVVTPQSFANTISSATSSSSSNNSSSSTTTTSASSASSAASPSPAPSTCAAAANNPAVAVTNTAQPTVHSALFCSDKDAKKPVEPHGDDPPLVPEEVLYEHEQEETICDAVDDESNFVELLVDALDDEAEEQLLLAAKVLGIDSLSSPAFAFDSDDSFSDVESDDDEPGVVVNIGNTNAPASSGAVETTASCSSEQRQTFFEASEERKTAPASVVATDATASAVAKKRKLNTDDSGSLGGHSNNSSIADNDEKDGDKDDAKKKKNRCATCRKKVGLTGFECRCGGLFCAIHRYSDKHECSFDYRELGAAEIRRNNPVVVGEKIQKI